MLYSLIKKMISFVFTNKSNGKEHHIGITAEINGLLIDHLLSKAPNQEEMCIIMYRQGNGLQRNHFLLTADKEKVFIPQSSSDRELHGNVFIKGEYIEKCAEKAKGFGCGIAVLHSHPLGQGPQGMSSDDYKTEESFAPFVYGITEKPLIGITLSGDRKWSGRVWEKDFSKRGVYHPKDISNFRVIGKTKISLIQNINELDEIKEESKKVLQVSIASYGKENQKIFSNMKVGIVGLGSVGSIVAESLTRIGVKKIILNDHDIVEKRNLDRLMHATNKDIGKLKISIVKKKLQSIGLFGEMEIEEMHEKFFYKNKAFKRMLDCDIVFCCVDNADARHAINKLAFWYLIPVIETGLTVTPEEKNGEIKKIGQSSSFVHTLLPGFQCLQCLRQCVVQEQYLQTGDTEYKNRGRETVFPLCALVASTAVWNMIMILSGEKPCSRIRIWFCNSIAEFEKSSKNCDENTCFIPSDIAKGD